MGDTQELEEKAQILKGAGWMLGGVAVTVAITGTVIHNLHDEYVEHPVGIGLGVIGDVTALTGAAALIEAGRRTQRRADMRETALLQATEYKMLTDRVDESLRRIEVSIDDAVMELSAAYELPPLPPHGEPQAYL